VGGPCEGCGEVFNGMPEVLSDSGVIAPPGEPGERMTIGGTVRRADGSAAPGVVVYAYHTDAGGIYPPEKTSGRRASPHGRLRGWVRSGPGGRYAFSTIRPMGYPNGRAPQHVHMHVIEPGRCTYYIDDIMFLDDPRVPAGELKRHSHGRGGAGLVRPVRGPDGEWVVTRDILLGAGIADYANCEGTKR
jgi:protocatechuate 3,4-dioxygenase beta subunit